MNCSKVVWGVGVEGRSLLVIEGKRTQDRRRYVPRGKLLRSGRICMWMSAAGRKSKSPMCCACLGSTTALANMHAGSTAHPHMASEGNLVQSTQQPRRFLFEN
jgi:hypothetical protein